MMHKAWSSIEEVPYCFSRASIKFQGHSGQKIADFDPNWAFPDCNSSLNSPMALKWCTKLNVVLKRFPIVFHSDPSNFKVIGDKKSPILIQIGHFQTVNPVWIQWWVWNDAQSLMQHRRAALLFFKVIIKFQGHTQKIANFDPNWALPEGVLLQSEFIGFEMMHKA